MTLPRFGMRGLSLTVILAAGLAVPALGQTRAPARSTPAPAAPAKPPDPPPDPPAAPYEKDLLRLSEIVGALAFLRELCASPDAAQWPARMRSLLDAEGTTPARRERLAGAYNRGYRGYALTYRACTPSAHEAAGRYIAEGERLSQNLTARYGG